VVLGPTSWSPRGPSFHTGKRACGTTVVPALYLGRGPTRGPSTTPPWDHAWSQAPMRRAGPARSDGAEGRVSGRAHGRSRTVRVTRPPVVVAPLTGSWEGTVAGAVHCPDPTRSGPDAQGRVAWFTLTL